jgi:hemolysin activation/secretion protein
MATRIGSGGKMVDRSARRAAAFAIAAMGMTLASAFTSAVAAPTPVQTAPTRQQAQPSSRNDIAARRRTGDLFSAAPTEGCTLPDDQALKFKLQDVTVEGATRLSPEAVAASYADLRGTEVTPAALCEIRDRISDRIFHQGVLARVLIPQQTIADGHVRLTVIEAQIISVRVHGDIGPAQAQVEAYLNHLRGLTPFDLDTAQRYLLLANDVPGVRANARLVHSSAAGAPRGGLDLDVSLERAPYDAVGALENTSSKALGPWSGIARADLNSFTRFGERTTLIGYTTLGNNSQQVVELIEQAHLGDSGLYAQGSIAYGVSHPGDVLKPLHLKGESVVGTFELDEPIVRLKRANLTVGGGFDYIDQKTDFPSGGPLTNDKLRVVWIDTNAAFDHIFHPKGMSGLTGLDGDLMVEARKGLQGLGASPFGAPALSRPAGRSDAWVVRTEGHLAIHGDLTDGLPVTASVHFEAQWSDKPLLAYEELAIGNLTVGEGYDPGAASGDRVEAAELKLALGPFKVAPETGFKPYAFFATAHVANLDPGSQDVNLRSVGVGVEIRLPRHVRADIDFAQPLSRTAPSSVSVPPSRVLVRLVASF